ncbi:hypothetical protein HNY73_015230 [Argiope bruennichi]|uniref:Uncharacterized protein n=1 Tax=Argiope bruennichi TaxID=94029 RepID=A0A8T0EVU7_ARGBR|nr:hypothetical protein HNY73_015230 [Argiope bruennichi]
MYKRLQIQYSYFLYLMEPVEGLIAIDNVNATLEEEEDKEFEIYLDGGRDLFRVQTHSLLLTMRTDKQFEAFGNGETCNDTAEEVVYWEESFENPWC